METVLTIEPASPSGADKTRDGDAEEAPHGADKTRKWWKWCLPVKLLQALRPNLKYIFTVLGTVQDMVLV